MMKFFAELRRRNVLRVAGTFLVGSWFLVQIAYTLESVMNLPDWFDAIFMALLILGLPVAIILAWAFELTPEGFKRTEVVPAEDSIAEKTGKKLDIAILVGLFLIGGLLIYTNFVTPSGNRVVQTKIAGNSVAVLPFENRSADANNAFFADGIHDELLTALSKVSGLDVISRTSVMGYRNTEKRIPDIAQELGAAAVLEGAVQKSGARVRITVQLIDGKDDTHIWANNYDRALTTENLFDIQGEITQVIADSLKDVLGGKPVQIAMDRPTENVAAFEAYIQGKLKTRPGEGKKEDLLQAIMDYQRAIEIDPRFAKAWGKKAYAELALYWFHGRDEKYLEAGKTSLEQARTLGPNIPETHLAEAFYQYWGTADFEKAQAAFDAALSVAPGNVEALAGQAFMTRRAGNFEDALKGLLHAHRLDPLSFYLIPETALTHALLGQDEAAQEMLDKAKAMDSSSLQLSAFAAAVAQFGGDVDAAYALFEPLGALLPETRVRYALATRDLDKVEESFAAWPESRKSSPQDRANLAIAKMRAALQFGTEAEQEAAREVLRFHYQPGRDWQDGLAHSPVVMPGLLCDIAEIRRVAAAYETAAPNDSLQNLSDYSDIAEAFARCGLMDEAMDYNEEQEAIIGPVIMNVIEKDPGMDNIRDHPRYKAMLARAQN